VPRHFTLDYVERVTLSDGTPIVLRLLAPDDRELLRRGFETLSPESRYARFLEPRARLTDAELRYLTDIDQEHHFALGAIRAGADLDGSAVGLGIARFVRLPDRLGDPVTAEAAVAVADAVQRRGLGRMLLSRLVAAAVERGIERFHCEIACSNAAMKQLIDSLAVAHTTEVSAGVMSIYFALPAATAPHADTAPPPPIYGFLRAAGQGLLEWTEAVKRLWRRGE
jgi:GNAT superfamily N-acetyltransferase